MAKWLKPGYLLGEIQTLPPQENAVTVTPTPYFWGSDTPKHWLRPGQPELVFGEDAAPPGEYRYAGLVDLQKLRVLVGDVLPRPPFLLGPPHGPTFNSQYTRDALWASNSHGYVDSGLHWDENRGGFLTQVVGTKEVILFPHTDLPHLYMRTIQGHMHESSVFLSRDLAGFRDKFPNLVKTSPQVVLLRPGDTLYVVSEASEVGAGEAKRVRWAQPAERVERVRSGAEQRIVSKG